MNTTKIWVLLILLKAVGLKGQTDSVQFFLDEYGATKEKIWLDHANDHVDKSTAPKVRAEVKRQTGLYFYNQDQIVESFPFFLDAIKFFEEANDTSGLVKSHLNIALAYYLSRENELAIKHAELSLKYAEYRNELNTISIILGNLGAMYEMQPEMTSRAFETYERLINICQEIDDSVGLQVANNNIGVLYAKEGLPEKAAFYYENALDITERLGLFEDRCRIIVNLLDVYTRSKNYTDGKAMIELSDTACLNVDIRLQALKAKRLSEYYEAIGDYKSSLNFLAAYQTFNDSVFSEERTRIIHDLTEEYESAKKIQTITLLEKDKELQNRKLAAGKMLRNGLIAITLIMGFFGGILFIQRNKLAKEKSRSEALLLNILPADVAEELKESGHSPARQFNNVTVIFTDFVNFTKVSEHLTPNELVSEIHNNFTAFDDIIQRNGLEKIKTIGDAYLAVCGMPNEAPDHAFRCMMAAIEIMHFVKSTHGPFDIRIGLHSGPVVAGIVGVKKYAYDIWGDTVNTAARMEQNSVAGRINISQSTYNLVKDEFEFIHRGKIEAKNKGQIDMYFYQPGI